MTPGARLAAVIELLDALDTHQGPADRFIADWLRARRFIGSKDRQAILDRLYGIFRSRAALDWWIGHAGAGLPVSGRTRVIASLALSDRIEPGAPAGLFGADTYATPSLSEAEAAFVAGLSGRTLDDPDAPPNVRGNFPAWLEPSLRRRFPEDFERELAALNEPAAVDLRVNTLKTTWDAARAALAAAGIETEPMRYSPIGLRFRGRRPLAASAPYRDGLVEVQDEGAQLIALLTGGKPGMQVMDYCAGAGGKALAIAARMENRGELTGLDVSPRLNRAGPRIERAEASIIQLMPLVRFESNREKNAARFDRVLLDVPCSGTGTWRRDPLARWRLTPESLASLVGLQQQILLEGADLVTPGGRLIYATCSLLCEEDEDQAQWFAGQRSDFSPVPIPRVWAEEIGGQCPASGPYLLLTPARHGTDGFFVAVFERKAS